MSLFASTGKVHEKCACGSEFTYTGPMPNLAMGNWRRGHACDRRLAPWASATTPTPTPHTPLPSSADLDWRDHHGARPSSAGGGDRG